MNYPKSERGSEREREREREREQKEGRYLISIPNTCLAYTGESKQVGG